VADAAASHSPPNRQRSDSIDENECRICRCQEVSGPRLRSLATPCAHSHLLAVLFRRKDAPSTRRACARKSSIGY
jgi:hypothetical protein